MSIKLISVLKSLKENDQDGIINFQISEGTVIFECNFKCKIPFPGKWEEVHDSAGFEFNYVVDKKYAKIAAAWAAMNHIQKI